jgi:hypothetical protein
MFMKVSIDMNGRHGHKSQHCHHMTKLLYDLI